jgi:hypothetical protein
MMILYVSRSAPERLRAFSFSRVPRDADIGKQMVVEFGKVIPLPVALEAKAEHTPNMLARSDNAELCACMSISRQGHRRLPSFHADRIAVAEQRHFD